MGLSEDDDAIGKSTKVIAGAIRKSDALVYAQNLAEVGRWFVLDYDVEIVDLFEDPLGERFKYLVDGCFELGWIHLCEIISISTWMWRGCNLWRSGG